MSDPNAIFHVVPPFTPYNKLDSLAKECVDLTISLLVLCTTAVGLRLAAHAKQKRKTDLGDIFLVVALCLFGAHCGLIIRATQTSGGTLQQSEFTPGGTVHFFKFQFAIQIVYPFCLTFVKCSILMLYITIFDIASFRRVAYIIMGICGLWAFVFLFFVIFQCTPIHSFWDFYLLQSGKGKCIPFGNVLVGYEVSNMLIDIAILSLPVRVIKSLRLPLSRKIGAAFIFLLGGFVIVICAIRLGSLYNAINSVSKNELEGLNWSTAVNWSTAELGVAIICACFPAYGPYIQSAIRMWTRTSSWLGLRTQGSNITSLSDQSTKLNSRSETIYSRKQFSSESLEHVREDVHLNSFDTGSS